MNKTKEMKHTKKGSFVDLRLAKTELDYLQGFIQYQDIDALGKAKNHSPRTVQYYLRMIETAVEQANQATT